MKKRIIRNISDYITGGYAKIKELLKRLDDEIMVSQYPQVERPAFLLFFCSLGVLFITGFFFAVFIPRGMFGFFLLLHLTAGGIFAGTLAILTVLRIKVFSSSPVWRRSSKNSHAARQPKAEIIIERNRAIAARLLVFAGLFQALSALALMTPIFSVEDNACITAWHRWVGLLAAIGGVVYAYFPGDWLERCKR